MESEMNEQKLIKDLGIRLEQKTIELANATKQNVLLRNGLIAFRKEAEAYGETWARCYVADFDRVAVDSKEARFKLLAVAQDRLKDFADALDATADLAGLVVCDAEPIAWHYEGSDIELPSVALSDDLDDEQKQNCTELFARRKEKS
jgi:hypothetical protein